MPGWDVDEVKAWPLVADDPIPAPPTPQELARRQDPDDLSQLLTLYDCGPSLYIGDQTPDFSTVLDRALSDQTAYAAQRERYFSWVFGSRDRMANERVARAIQTHLL